MNSCLRTNWNDWDVTEWDWNYERYGVDDLLTELKCAKKKLNTDMI